MTLLMTPVKEVAFEDIAVQEMLMQEVGDTLYLFPAWPKEWDVRFRLRASRGTVVEAELRQGKVINVRVTPTRKSEDIVIP